MTPDTELLRRYAKTGSDSAFAELVSRYSPLVYSAALRQVHANHELAKDVAQTVFIDLARKARSLSRHEVLSGWLYTSTRFAAQTARRTEHRRQAREQTAAAMQLLDTPSTASADWEALTPVLDDAMHELSLEERNAVLLRFFERKPLKEVGAALGLREDAARMRVTRALGKLHSLLTARGIGISGAALAALLAAGAVQAAPAALATTIAAAALANAAGASGSLLHTFFHVRQGRWKALALPGLVLLVAVTLGLYLKARPSKATPQPVPQLTAAQLISPSPAPASADNFVPGVAPTPSPPQMRFELLEAETGAAIPGAKLEVNYGREGGQMKAVKLETRNDGSALVDQPTPPYDWFNVFATADGHVPKVVGWTSGERPEAYTMKVETGTVIGGVVLDESQRPVAGAKVEFDGPGIDIGRQENLQFGPDTIQTTDATGHWSCNMVPREQESIRILVTHSDFAVTHITAPVNTAQATNLVLVIKQGAWVTGVVTDTSGNPIPGASVRQVHNTSGPELSMNADAGGRFEFKHLPAGELMLTVQASGYAPLVLETNVVEQPLALAFALEPGNLLWGHVVDQGGRPITNALVQTDWDDQGLRRIEWAARTDGRGRFEWDSAPADALSYSVEAEGFGPIGNQLLKADGADHELRLARQEPLKHLTGTAIDEDTGRPLDEFKVLVKPLAGPAAPEFNFATDGTDGRFSLTLDPVRCGPVFRVKVEKEGYVSVVSTNLFARKGDQSLALELHRGTEPAPSAAGRAP